MGATGLLTGNPMQLAVQVIATLGTIAYAGVMAFILLKVIDATIGLRVEEDDEREGTDLSQHSETAYG